MGMWHAKYLGKSHFVKGYCPDW